MKKIIVPLLAIIILALCVGGFAFAWEILKTLAYTFYTFFVSLLPFLDIEQMVICKIVTIAIVQLLCGAGFWVSRKTESTIGSVVSGIADIIATILLLIA